MSATTALGAAPPEAAGEETAAATTVVELEEEQKAAEAAKRQAEEQEATERTEETAENHFDADDTAEVSDDETVIAPDTVAEEVPASGEDLRPMAETPQSGEAERSHAERGNERDAQVRSEAVSRVRQTAALPPGLRERLAALVESGGQVGGEGQTLVSIDDAIRAVAESLPSSLRLSGGDASRPEHPGGESFFSSRTEGEITDQQAEEIARGQLARSGLLRGQRVRVAD